MAEDLKVLVLMEKSLLEHGVVRRLLEEPDLTVRVVDKACANLSATLAAFEPDVSILDETETPLLKQILAIYPKTSVVTLSLNREGAMVYRAKHLSIGSVKDLVRRLKKPRRRSPGPEGRARRGKAQDPPEHKDPG